MPQAFDTDATSMMEGLECRRFSERDSGSCHPAPDPSSESVRVPGRYLAFACASSSMASMIFTYPVHRQMFAVSAS